MNKKLIIFVVLVIGVFFGYKYLYHDHRDIANEKAAFSLKVADILSEFQADETKANAKYLDKSILIRGKVTSVDPTTKTIVIDEKVFAILIANTKVGINSEVAIQGRLIGYDSLLDEIKLDQTTIK